MPTKIEWCDETWNPVTGCTKVSQGCKHCYAEREWPRLTKLVPAYAGREFSDVRTHTDRLDQPLHWKRPRRIFVNSMSDLFHEDVPFEFIDKTFAVMAMATQHTFQVLTKRPLRMLEYFKSFKDQTAASRGFNVCAWADQQFGINDTQIALIGSTPKGLRNVWLGVSVEDQAAADERIPLLLKTPAAVRWISAEPLLGPVSLVVPFSGAHVNAARGAAPGIKKLDWVVVGGESGPNARPMHPNWVRNLRDQCAAAGVPFLFKQWGEWGDPDSITAVDTAHHGWWEDSPEDGGVRRHEFDNRNEVFRVGKKHTGRLLDGVQHDGYPEIVR